MMRMSKAIDDQYSALKNKRAAGVHHRREPSSDAITKNLVGQVAPQALPDLRKYPIMKLSTFPPVKIT
jgi:hypothetical protein